MEKVEFQIVTPQFTRPAGDPPTTWTPTDREDFDSLPTRTDAELQEIGLRRWGDVPEGSGRMLWLYPCEWYAAIPEGYPITSILGEQERFRRGVTDDDRRFGMLSYGFMKPEDK